MRVEGSDSHRGSTWRFGPGRWSFILRSWGDQAEHDHTGSPLRDQEWRSLRCLGRPCVLLVVRIPQTRRCLPPVPTSRLLPEAIAELHVEPREPMFASSGPAPAFCAGVISETPSRRDPQEIRLERSGGRTACGAPAFPNYESASRSTPRGPRSLEAPVFYAVQLMTRSAGLGRPPSEHLSRKK